MATKEELYFEAYKRGILPPEKKPLVEELAKRRGIQLTTVSQGEPRPQQPDQVQQPETTTSGIAGGIIRGVGPYAAGAALGAGMGAMAGGVGALPGAIAGTSAVAGAELIGDPIVAGVNQLLGTNYQMPTDALQDLFTRLGVPQPDTEAERIVQTAASGAAGAGGFINLGQMLARSGVPVIANLGKSLMAQPASQVAGGALGGATGQAASEADLGVAGEFGGAIVGGMVGGKTASLRMPDTATTSRVAEDIEKAGIKALTSDVLPPETYFGQFARAIGERIPFIGTGVQRAAQQKQRIEAVRSFLKDYGVEEVDDTITDRVMNDFLKTRGNTVTRYATNKKEIINNVSEQAGPIEFNRTRSLIDDEIERLRDIEEPEINTLISHLEDFRDTIGGKTLSVAEKKREILGNRLGNDSLANVKNEAEKVNKAIYRTLNEEMGDKIAIHGGPRSYDKWKIANRRLSNMMDELRKTNIKQVLDKGDATPEQINKMLFSSNRSDIQRLYRNLSPEGRANAKTAILNRALSNLPKQEPISPDRFAKELKKLSKSTGVFFNQNDMARAKGLMRAIEATERASQAATQPLLAGVQVLSAAALTDLVGGLGGSLVVGGGIGSAARLYESAPVRAILTRLPRTTKGSKEEAALLKRLVSAIQSQKPMAENE